MDWGFSLTASDDTSNNFQEFLHDVCRIKDVKLVEFEQS